MTPALAIVTPPVTGRAMQDIKRRAALTSIGASAGLTIAKAVIGLATGSLAILSEAAHSLLDLAATIMTYFAVRVSGRPADAEHHYGHGKVESVTALAETALLFLLTGWLVGGKTVQGWRILRRDGGQTPSPNGGRPMATMAGLLEVRLNKKGVYSLGDAREKLKLVKVRQAWRIVVAAGLATAVLCALVLLVSVEA